MRLERVREIVWKKATAATNVVSLLRLRSSHDYRQFSAVYR